ncbi:FMRFamide receptor [Biomphalaria glabrata]|nr:FMRFamide receptor [Biomphalaria glabrata]
MNSTLPQVSYIYIDPLILDVLMVICHVIFSETLGLIGIIANIITIIIFCKNGFQDSVDVTLTALALSDIGSLVTAQIFNLIENPWALAVQFSFYHYEFLTLVSFFPHIYFIRVSGLITSFAAFERCICVVMPMKVKNIINYKKSIIINILIFVLSLTILFTPYYYLYFDWVFTPERNATMLRVITREHYAEGTSSGYFFSDLFIPYFTFSILITCTITTSIHLNKNARWRTSLASGIIETSGNKASRKELKVVRMLTVVSTMFIICLIPLSAVTTAVAICNDLSLQGPYFNIARMIYNFSFLMETVSSSMNPLVYYKMSSKYRKGILKLFTRTRE